jgi:hypothetical protein
VEDIEYDDAFFREKIEKVAESYKTILLPELFEMRLPRRLDAFKLPLV